MSPGFFHKIALGREEEGSTGDSPVANGSQETRAVASRTNDRTCRRICTLPNPTKCLRQQHVPGAVSARTWMTWVTPAVVNGTRGCERQMLPSTTISASKRGTRNEAWILKLLIQPGDGVDRVVKGIRKA